ncbi:hypothetical protein [Burkholderia cenocepacia]|uniref:hypothetical protein n=1 Tax=Burkholderia cenocepacia TaxID=95486 RepID=UPI00111573E8|nr:hypothetical protein [Burkholderia cenocepacia]
MNLKLPRKKLAIVGGSILLTSAIGIGSYFALHTNKKQADNDMFTMSIPKPAVQAPVKEEKPVEPVQQASVPVSTPTPNQPVAVEKPTPKRWQDMNYDECETYNKEVILRNSKQLGAAKDGMQALSIAETVKFPKCDQLPDAPNKPQGIKTIAPTQEPAKPVEEVKPTPTPQPKPHKVKKPHVDVVRETVPAHTAPVQPTPQPAAKAWYQ